MSPDQIKLIQKSGIDWYGNPLKVDGLLGPKTEWWIGITTLSPVRQEILRIALGYHASGMKEENGPGIENGGTFVDMLLAPVKLRNKAWCIAFISHCYKKAGVKLPIYFTGAEQLIEWAIANGCIVTDPLPSDIEVFLHPKQPENTYRQGHGRILTGYDKNTGVTAGVDGNSRDAVRCGFRRDRESRYFVRLPGLGTDHNLLTMPQKMMYLDNLEDR